MAISKHPREWIAEILGAFLSVWGLIRSLSQGDYIFLAISFVFLMTILNHTNMRLKHEISVRDRR